MLIVALVGFKVYDSQPKSLLDVVQVQFRDDESGTLTYNSDEVTAGKLQRNSLYKKLDLVPNKQKDWHKKITVTFSEVTEIN